MVRDVRPGVGKRGDFATPERPGDVSVQDDPSHSVGAELRDEQRFASGCTSVSLCRQIAVIAGIADVTWLHEIRHPNWFVEGNTAHPRSVTCQ